MEKHSEFLDLFKEFVDSYLLKSQGEEHSAYYVDSRRQARKNLEDLIEIEARGEDITEQVILKLLPYADTSPNRRNGLWSSPAWVFVIDARRRLEASGIVKQEDWPRVARIIFNFVLACDENPDQLPAVCANFVSSPYSKGFQAGTLTPILNALHPEKFVIINRKSRLVLNYFTGNSYTQNLKDYPMVNSSALALIVEVAEDLQNLSNSNMLAIDLYDMFSHWLVAIKKHPLIPLFKTETKVSDEKREILVSVPGPEDVEEIEAGTIASENGSTTTGTNHTQVQYLLLTLGAEMGLDVWVARNDKSKAWLGETLGSLPQILEQLPTQFNEVTQKTIELIDVLWLKGNSIVSAFEVECTTSIYSGLLRMGDLLALQPNLDIKLYLVAPEERREKVMQELLRPTFKLRVKPLNKICGFLSLEDLIEKVEGIRKLGLAKDLSPDFLTSTAEYLKLG